MRFSTFYYILIICYFISGPCKLLLTYSVFCSYVMMYFSDCLFIFASHLHLSFCLIHLPSISPSPVPFSLPHLFTFPPPFSIHPSIVSFWLAGQRLSQRSVTLSCCWVNYSASIKLTRKQEDREMGEGAGIESTRGRGRKGKSERAERWMRKERKMKKMMKRRKVKWGRRRKRNEG